MNHPPFRIGHGYDLHRVQPGGELFMAGVLISRQLSAIAHSDGDVALHALVDALLGAIGQGDIGEMFPNTDPQWHKARSEVFVTQTMRRVRQAGWEVGNVDLTILAERPRMAEHKPAMRQVIAQLLGVAVEQVNLKAGTNEQCDAIGQGKAIAAHAVALLIAQP